MNKKKRVAIVDDHLLIAKAIASLVSQMDAYEVSIELSNGKEFMEWVQNAKYKPDIVLLDINMPLMNGYETAIWTKANFPEINIIALSMINDEPSIINMIKAGASGYLLKDIHPTELKKALDTVLEKGVYYSEWVANKLIRSFTSDDLQAQVIVKLTTNEKQFLKMACTELGYKEIASQMNLSVRTIEGYRDQLFLKLGVKTRVGLVLFAIKSQLVNL
jgi:DNA-binding NarL/FixJ family response regulator